MRIASVGRVLHTQPGPILHHTEHLAPAAPLLQALLDVFLLGLIALGLQSGRSFHTDDPTGVGARAGGVGHGFGVLFCTSMLGEKAVKCFKTSFPTKRGRVAPKGT